MASFCCHVKARAFGRSFEMSDLCISPVFEDVTFTAGGQQVSSMYFGRHCGKNVLILQYDITLMLVFKGADQSVLNMIFKCARRQISLCDFYNFCSSSLDFMKSVSSKGIAIRGIQIAGNEDVLLLLDDTGRLWRLVNAFEFPKGKDQRLHSLDEKCFYEWMPFKKLNLEKVLAVSAWGSGFACLGTCSNSEKKLLLLPSADSHFVKDNTFEEIRSSSSFHFYLTHIRRTIEDSTNKTDLTSIGDTVLIADKFTGKTYLCSQDGTNSLINYSNNLLVSVLHFTQGNCALLGFSNGKLVFHFLNFSTVDCIVYLPKHLSLMEKCCCSSTCLLWADDLHLHHTRLIFRCQKPSVKLLHFKLCQNIEKPSHIVRLQTDVLVATINNIYYHVRVGPQQAVKIQRGPEEVLSDICKGSLSIHELNTKVDMISYFVHCKQILDRSDIKEKVEMSLEENYLVIKFHVNLVLRRDLWKVRLMVCCLGKKYVKMADLETDVSEGMLVRIENPFKSKRRMKISLIGDFDGEGLCVELGEVGESGKWGGDELRNNLKQILVNRNPYHRKEKSSCS